MTLYQDRAEAGRALARQLVHHQAQSPLVLGLPRGGVPVAYEVARALQAPLDVWVVRKVSAPFRPELGVGAVAEGGEVFLDEGTVRDTGASTKEVRELVARKTAEVDEACRRFRRGRAGPDVTDKTVLVVDDGIATGGTAHAALRSLRRRKPRHLTLAVPVAPADILESLASEADEILCLSPQPELHAIGLWYRGFAPVEDDEVTALLGRARSSEVGTAPERAVRIEVPDAELLGDMTVPPDARGVVLFAHGAGGSRKRTRHRFLAAW